MKRLPNGFLLGAATAAHQVEGNNTNSDFWCMELLPGSTYKEPSGIADDHYNRYADDIALMAQNGYNAYRFSIEWARIEPQQGEFDANEIAHYRNVLLCCKENGIEPIVTLHHFSSPKWLIMNGGWKNEDTVTRFACYAQKIAQELGDLLSRVCTINEANMGRQLEKIIAAMRSRMVKDGDVQVGVNMGQPEGMKEYFGALAGEFRTSNPMDINTFLSGRGADEELLVMRAHNAATKAMRTVSPHLQIGLTLSLYDVQVLPGGEAQAQAFLDEDFFHYLPFLQEDDFIGVQNYSRRVLDANGVVATDDTTRVTKMGYEFYPQAIGNVVRFVAQHWSKDIIITENGISTDDDAERIEFIDTALEGVLACVQDGIPVKGYMHWSLMDNFEWQLGYAQTFGLIAVDRDTMERKPKQSFYHLGKKTQPVE